MYRLPNLLTAIAIAIVAFAVFASRRSDPTRANSHTFASDSAQFVLSGPPPDAPGGTLGVTSAGQSRTGAPFAATVRQPAGPPRVEVEQVDPQGRVGSVACSTCHSVRPADSTNYRPGDFDEFHLGMQFDHGKITCYACHNPSHMDTLRLADGSAVEYRDVMNLCSQCHGAQADAFAHGAHGGMNGFWDLTRGPQQRNNCIDCHDPHAPSFPKMIPTFKPRDRFLEPLDRQPVSGSQGEQQDAH